MSHLMNSLFIIVTSFAAVFAFAFFFAGFSALQMLDADEGSPKSRRLRSRNLFQQLTQPVATSDFSLLAAHWRSRPKARRDIALGFFFLLAAIITGYFCSWPT